MILFHLSGFKCLKHFYTEYVAKHMTNLFHGKLMGDKGYISKGLFEKLFVDGIQLVTKLRNNMKGALMTIGDKLLIRKRALIETINDELKNMAQVEHSRHRSVSGFTVNFIAALSAFHFFPQKPMIDVERYEESYDGAAIQLSLF